MITAARRLSITDQAPAFQNNPVAVQPLQGEQLMARPIVKLPNIDLPKFEGNYEKWIPFRDLFESLIASNVALPDVQKLHYLRSALTGEAAKIVNSLEILNDNYAVAWNLLKQRFENKRLIVQYLIQLLLDIPAITRESYADLRQLVDNLSQYTQSLTKLDQPVESWSTMIIHIILPKIDKGSRREWESKRSTIETFPTLTEFSDYLINRSAFLEAVNRAKQNSQNMTASINRNVKITSGHHKGVTQAYVTSNSSCPTCSGGHGLRECQVFLKMSVNERILEVKKKRLCIKCFKSFHGRNCRSSNCKMCNGYHNTLLHKNNSSNHETSDKLEVQPIDSTKQVAQLIVDSKTIESSTVLNHCTIRKASQVLLATAIIHIRDCHCTMHECRALLDNGSQSNFITKELSERLHLKQETINTTIIGISNIPINTIQGVQTIIQSRINSFQCETSFLVINQITERMSMIEISKNLLHIPSNIKLADPNYGTPGKIDVLLGASIFWELICNRQIRRMKNTPVFQERLLGWIISGPVYTNNMKQHEESYCGISINNVLQRQLEKFWEIEEIELPIHRSDEEIQCEKHFIATHSRNEDGRFVVQLPLKRNKEELGKSFDIAEKRLKALGRKLERQPELKEQYHEFMTEYLKLGHMTKIQIDKGYANPTYYIPHHAVVKEKSTTTKVRVVFDASCKTSSGKSLNEILMVGPTIQDNLFDIIIRLRQYKHAMAADIAKMYRQVRLKKEDRKLQRILRRWERKEPIQIFELNTITYGMASSPFLAIKCLQEPAQQMEHKFKNASEIIRRDFYVDDLLTGADTVEALIQLKQEIIFILNSSKFELRKWISNMPEISDQIDSTPKEVTLSETTKILGLWWNPTADKFQYRINLNNNEHKITKRNILARVAQVYDPLGLVGPIVVQIKILIQRLWQSKCNWDEEVTNDIKNMWIQWKSQISSVEELMIPRRIICDKPMQIELHGFCDASEQAYGACIYLRSTTSREEYTVRLLCAKSRVAPIKRLSLPRLELCGVMLLAKLTREPTQWKTFVANRVAEIQHETREAQWYHVKSENNPADLLSRGVNPDKLKDKRIWWEGPQFLHQNSVFAPFSDENSQEEVIERRTTSLFVHNEVKDAYTKIIKKFSSLARLQRVIAYCLRFKNNGIKGSAQKTKSITVEEKQQAMKALIKGCQIHSFPQELHNLHNKIQLNSKSRLLTLHPFIDDDGIIRVGGRLCNASIEYSQKHPIILPNKHHLTKLIIRDIHYRNLHAGAQAVLTITRNNYWPISGKEAIRRVLRSCIVCFRAKPITTKQLMGNLPAVRVTQQSRAFLHTGVDYAGPFTIKISRNKTNKAYLSIFICLVTKAVHFELVSDLTTASFLNAMKRFFARRGKCITLYSDNGITLVGANNQLSELKDYLLKSTTQSQINEYLTEQFINWKFIPPYSPHMGGLWEAAVKSAKTHMRKIIGVTALNFEELYTILTLIEACLNSRPLTPLSNDPTDLQPLTPGHFLIGEIMTAIPEQSLVETATNRLTRYQLITQMKQHFWNRWSKEYIVQLQQRVKWKQASSVNISPGTMVILKNENTSPMTWPLGRVMEVHPGGDGIIRVVTIKTSRGTCKRAITKICILPIEDNN